MSVKFANALVQNLSIYDSVGYDLMGYYGCAFLSASAHNADLSPLVKQYLNEVRKLTSDLNWLTQDAQNRAFEYVSLVSRWLYAGTLDRNEAAQLVINFQK